MLRHIDGPEEEYLTVPAAAKWLGVPAATLKSWWEAGDIPAPQHLARGKTVRYSWRVIFAVRVLIESGWLPRPGRS